MRSADLLIMQLIEQCAEDRLAPVTVLDSLRDIIEEKRLIATEEKFACAGRRA